MTMFHGRRYAAEGAEFPAQQLLDNGGSVQDALTRPIREAAEREREAIAKAAQVQQAAQPVPAQPVIAADSGKAADAEPDNVTKDPDGITE